MRRESSWSIRFLLGHLFGLMAFSGLLLAWYGAWISPQEVRSVQELSFKLGTASSILNR